MTFKNTLRLIAADTRERCRLEQKRYGVIPYLKLLQNPPALVVTIFRFQHWLHRCDWTGLAEVLARKSPSEHERISGFSLTPGNRAWSTFWQKGSISHTETTSNPSR